MGDESTTTVRILAPQEPAEKPWYKSKRFWSAVAYVGGGAAKLLTLIFPVSATVNIIATAIALVAGGIGTYFGITTNSSIRLPGQQTKP